MNRVASLENLVEGLRGKSHRLASTPSIWPTRGWVTSGFGRRISPFTGRPQFHAGIDVAARFGTEVVAPGRGRVVFVGRKGPLGRTLIVDHGYGIRTTYGHLASVTVRKGQEVERGEPIAKVGSSGRATGPHLHYAVAVGRKGVDPFDYIFE
jgi:murein DD-endopeptidase MepM/ murein hydrolase activator NlpD